MLITPCFGFGGLERVVLSIAEEIDREKYNPSFCTLLTPAPEMLERMQQLDVRCHVLDKGRGINYCLPVKLRNLLLREKIQIVNSHDIGATLYAAIAARLAGIPAVIHTEHSQILTKSRHLGLYRWIFNTLVSYSITVSHDLEQYLMKTFNLRRDKVRTVPNGIDVEKFGSCLDLGYLRREFNLKGNETVIGTIGRPTTQKSIDTLLEAFRRLVAGRSDLRLIVVGDGDLRTSLIRLSEQLGIRNKVVFTGIRQDIAHLLHLFDVFVLPSLWEGQPITIMEAMAAEKPIVATFVGGNSEILRKGEFGLLIAPRDPTAMAKAIDSVLNDPSLAGRLAKKASVYARTHLSHRTMVKNYEVVFGALVP
jgi:glycosyltransferase involved in cell wall biosynthesis